MSETKKYFYLKLKENFFQTNEMRILKSLPNGVIFQNIYLQMCLLSLQNGGALTYKNMLPYDATILATLLDFEVGTVKLAIETFERMGLVVITDTQTIFMTDIQTLIGQSSTEAERQQKYRQRIKDSDKNVTNVTTNVVQKLQNRTPESESELESELELKTETEFKDRDIFDRHCVNANAPEPEEVYQFYHEERLRISPERFWNINQDKNWLDDNGSPLENWKGAYIKLNRKAEENERYNLYHTFDIKQYKGVKEIL